MLSNSVINIRLNIEKNPLNLHRIPEPLKTNKKLIFGQFFFLDLDIFTLIIAVFCDEVNKNATYK